MEYKRAICWFRNDLRLHDNETLDCALQQAKEVIPVYCFDPRQYGNTTLQLSKAGPFRAKFIRESLFDLKHNLQDRGADLVILHGKPEKVLLDFAKLHEADAIFFSKEATAEELLVEGSLLNGAKNLGISCKGTWQATLFHPQDLPIPLQQLPEVFTAFRKICEKESRIRALLATPQDIPFPLSVDHIGKIPSLLELGLENPALCPSAVLDFKGGESEALKRVSHYLWNSHAIVRYKQTRNGLLGADYSSKLSPWLAVGALSPRWVYAEIQNYEREVQKNDSTYWLIFELIWRDYFRFIAKKHGTAIFKPSGIRERHRPWKRDKKLFEAWANGTTGIPLIDANMRELNQSGFMSNRGRQLVASFLVNDLEIDWTWGASYFESMLIDYDVCSNWGNWMYVAGVGNDPRADRYFNLTTQAKNYDPLGDYIRHWIPELGAIPGFEIHRPDHIPTNRLDSLGITLGIDYPQVMVKPKTG